MRADLAFLGSRAARRRILGVTFALLLCSVVYTLLAPKWYRATSTFVPAGGQRGGNLAAMLGGDLGAMAGGLMEAQLGGNADTARIAAVLRSAAVSDAVIEKFQLRARYDERYQEAAREELWSHCDVAVLPKPSLVQLSCEDKDPRLAQEMVSFFGSFGNKVFRGVGVSSASEEVRFLEKRVAELRTQADQASAAMRGFQETHGIVDIESQSKAMVSALATLNSQRISKQLELDFARGFSAGDATTMRQLHSELAVMDEKQRAMEEAPGDGTAEAPRAQGANALFPPALTVPKLRAQFEKLYRDRKVVDTTLLYALGRLENAKADEVRDTSTFQVLDPATIPTKRSRPKRTLIVVACTLLGFAGVTFFEWWRSTGFRILARARGRATTSEVRE